MSIFGSNRRNALAGGLASGLGQAEARKLAAWAKARAANTMLGPDYRVDDLGNLIKWQDYGKHSSLHGWEIDHAYPSALGGTDHFSNLRALHCSANRSLGGRLGNALNRS
jgi:hypothetical protein